MNATRGGPAFIIGSIARGEIITSCRWRSHDFRGVSDDGPTKASIRLHCFEREFSDNFLLLVSYSFVYTSGVQLNGLQYEQR